MVSNAVGSSRERANQAASDRGKSTPLLWPNDDGKLHSDAIDNTLIVYAFVDEALSPDFPLGDPIEVFVRREDAERFIEEVRGDDPEAAAKLRIEERELEAGGLN